MYFILISKQYVFNFWDAGRWLHETDPWSRSAFSFPIKPAQIHFSSFV